MEAGFRDAHDLIWMRNPPPEVNAPDSLEALDAMEDQCAFLIQDGAPNCAAPEPRTTANIRPVRSKGMADVFTRIGDSQRANKWSAISEFSGYGALSGSVNR